MSTELLSSNEESILYAIFRADETGKECLNPQQISRHLVPEARIACDEHDFDPTAEIAESLVEKNYLTHCVPSRMIEGYKGYTMTEKGVDYAKKLQLGVLRIG